jgi:glycosyltransferase involved in cell wall biosynthesis
MPVQIYWLTHEFPPFRGGVATYSYEISKEALSVGAPVEFWVPGPMHSDDLPNVMRLNCGRKLNPWHHFQMMVEVWKRRRMLKNNKLILASYGAHLAVMPLVLFGGLSNVTICSLIYGSEIPRFDRNGFWRFIVRKFYKKISKVFVISKYTARLLKATSWGCDLQPAFAFCASSSAATQNVDIPSVKEDGFFRILTLARIHPRKGQLDTARAIACLPSDVKSKIIYQIGGTGDPSYTKEIQTFCLLNQIALDLLGEVPDDKLAGVYNSCDLFVMTSRTLSKSVEGFGISYIEAAWHGKPSIAYCSGGVEEAIMDGRTGFLVPESEIKAVAEAIQRLIQNPKERLALASSCREFARSFSWAKTLQVYLE